MATPKRFQFNIDNFSGGLTTDMRLLQETPRLASSWNFLHAKDRLIQHMGMEVLSNTDSHLLEHSVSNYATGQQPHIRRENVMSLEEDGSLVLYSNSCGHNSNSLNVGHNVEMAVEPIMFTHHVVYLADDGNVYAYQFESDPNLTTPAGTSTELFAGENFESNTFFTSMGSYLIVYGDRAIHVWDPYGFYGNLVVSNGKFVITQYMQSGDANGDPGTYTGFLGPYTNVIHEIDELQRLLNLLGYGPLVIDGRYGPATLTAVTAFQGENFATGNVPGGQAAGDALVPDGIVGPETQSALNLSRGNGEYYNVIRTNGDITAEANYGSYVAYATQEKNANATVFVWNTLLQDDGYAGENVISNTEVGNGVVQILAVVDGVLMAIMSPTSTARCSQHYNKLNIYGIQSSIDNLPPSRAILLREYDLKISGEDDPEFGINRYNYINRKSRLNGGDLYISGRLHMQHVENQNQDEGALSGIFHIKSNGDLFFDATKSDDSDDFPYFAPISFALVDSGFALSGEGKTYITDSSEKDTVSGFITTIINERLPFTDKYIDNIYLGLHNTEDMDKAEVWIREVEDVNDSDAGWQLAYRGDTTETKFKNSIVINRMENGERFAKFRELQIMVKIFGICVEFTSLFMTGYLTDINE